MADKNANPAFDADEIGSLFKKAAAGGGSFSFAFGLGSKPENCGLMVDMRKPGQALKTQLKQASDDVKKICFGTFTVVDGDVRFLPEQPVKGIVKQLKRRFRDEGLLKYNPVLVDINGNPVDEESLPDDDGAETEAAPQAAPPAAPAPPQQGADLSALKPRLVALKSRIEALAKDQQAAFLQVFAKAVGQVRDGDAGATATVEGLERVLGRVSAQAAQPAPQATTAQPAPQAAPAPTQQTAAPDATARLTQALAGLVPRIRALPAGPAQAALGQAARAIQQMIAAGDANGAVAALRTLAADLQAAEQQGGETAKPPVVDIWNSAKETVDTGITKLQQALRGVRHPATDRIAEFGLAGLSGTGVQTALAAALLGHARAPGDAGAKAAVLKAVADYRAFLAGNELVRLADDNPFGVALNLATTLGRAMDDIEAAVA